MSLPWMKVAESLIGVKRAPQGESNEVIIEWAQEIGGYVAEYYTDDKIPWCGLFAAHCLETAGLKFPKDALSALAYGEYGVGLTEPSYGAIMVFKRNGGGHVGFYLGEDDEAYHILGGNQSSKVSKARIAKERLHAVRWPAGAEVIVTGKIDLDPDQELSTNEA